MPGTIKVGRVLGLQISVHWSWFFIFFLVTSTFSTELLKDYYPDWSGSQRWIVGALIAMVFFLSILLHEMSHSIIARRFGIPVDNITLFVFGGVSNLTREPDSARQEFWIAVVGPLTSFGIAAGLALAYVVLHPIERGAAGVCASLAAINLAIGVFNLLPGFPLDGGRVLRSAFWARKRNLLDATRLSSTIGQLVAYLIMAIGVVAFIRGDLVSGIWFFLIGNFLRSASAASYEELFLDTMIKGVPAATVARTDYIALAPEMTLDDLVEEYVLTGQGRAFPVLAGEELLGIITLTDLKQAPREQWSTTTVYRAMTPFNQLKAVGPRDDLARVLSIMAAGDINQVPLLDGHILRGLIHRSDVIRFIQVRQEVGDKPNPSA